MMALLPALLAMACGGVFVLALGVLGAFLVFRGVSSRRRAAESLNWPSTTGVVVETEIRESRNTDDDGNVDVSYYPRVVYTYEVAGQPQRSHLVAFGALKPVGSAAQVQKTLERFPVGSSVTVYYNPQKPSEAVLERAPANTQALIIIGAGCLVLALCIAGPLILGVINNLR